MAARVAPQQLALRAARSAPFAAAVGLLERLGGAREHVLPILMYHRVAPADERPDLDPALLSATPEAFEEQISFVAARRQPLSLDTLLAVRSGEAPLSANAVLVTFDDAYRDFADHAWPVLRRHGVPATLFVPTAYPDAPATAFWWDRLHSAIAATAILEVETSVGRLPLATPAERRAAVSALAGRVKELPHDEAMELVGDVCDQLDEPEPVPAVLSWDELRRLAADGVALAPHTRTHPLLNRLQAERARDEVRGSVDDLTREIGHSPPVFAYPAGGHDERTVRILAEEGFRVAFTIERGSNDLRSADWLRLRRVNVGRRASLSLLRAQLLPTVASVARNRKATA